MSSLQLQLLVSGHLAVTVFTRLYPAGELQGSVVLLTCYDGTSAESPSGNSMCFHRLFLWLTHMQLALFLFLPLYRHSLMLLSSFSKLSLPLSLSLSSQILFLYSDLHPFFLVRRISTPFGLCLLEIQILVEPSVPT
jgi:hypothetical protein